MEQGSRLEGDVAIRDFFVGIRDRIVQRSQIGKEKLDAAFARRELDRRLQDLGEKYYALATQGVAGVPDDLRNLLAEVDALAKQLQALREQLRRLEEGAA
jgi:polyhydroxyalkanoate synthesis regulator phasin